MTKAADFKLSKEKVPDEATEQRDAQVAWFMFQQELTPVVKDATNPAFRSAYATLTAVWEHVKPVMKKFGINVKQQTEITESRTTLVTSVFHGFTLLNRCEFPLVVTGERITAQAFGSALTYARRYSLVTALGIITDDDDDGNAASGMTNKQPAKRGQSVIEKDDLDL